jgi:hypothetical protein
MARTKYRVREYVDAYRVTILENICVIGSHPETGRAVSPAQYSW